MKNQRESSPLKKICTVAGVICVLLFMVIPAPKSLVSAAESVGSTGTMAMRVLGITLLAVFWWVGKVIPDWLTTVMMLCLWIMLADVPFNVAFAGFSSNSTWLIVGAFCLSEAVSRTGLFARISWCLLRAFPPTFNWQILAMLLVGAVCNPLIPSITAKSILGVTIARGVADAMDYAHNSNGRYALFVAAWIGFGTTGPAFLNGSIYGYSVVGALPETDPITYVEWLIAMIPWTIILLVGSFIMIKLLYKTPEQGAMTKEYAVEQYRKLGKLQGKERLSAIILTGAILMWVLESKIGINSAVTALLAAFFCFAFGILEYKDFATAPKWTIVVFLGGVLTLGTIFSRVGINIWLQTLLLPLFENLRNRYIVALVIILIVILLRFVLVAITAMIAIMMTVLNPVANTIGLSPFIVGMLVYTISNLWMVFYQNTTFVTAYGCVKDTLEYKPIVKACLGYIVICMIGCIASIPYWKMLHYI